MDSRGKKTDLQDFQDFIGFLLGDDGVVVEAAELTLEPEGIDVSRVKVFFLDGHHVT